MTLEILISCSLNRIKLVLFGEDFSVSRLLLPERSESRSQCIVNARICHGMIQYLYVVSRAKPRQEVTGLKEIRS
jgi:hypothetical protein